MTKLAVIYGRVSTKKQKEGENVESQIEALSKYAQQHGYRVPEDWILKDEGYSGSTLKRPSLDILRELIREFDIDAILVYSPDRLSRKLAFQMILEIEFQKHGVQLIFLNSPKAETAEDRLMLNLKGVFSEYERTQISERARRGRYYRARQGSVNVLSSAPYGYRYIKKGDDGKGILEIDTVKGGVVKDIFRWYMEGYSMLKITRKLQECRIPAPKGGDAWGRSTIRQVLKNSAYTGTAYFGKTEIIEYAGDSKIRRIKGKRRDQPERSRRVNSKDSWIPIKVPALISEEEFSITQEILEKNIKYSSRNTEEASILQGLIVCGNCGHPYYKKLRPSSKKKIAYYCCSNRMKGGKCDNLSLLQKDFDDQCWRHLVELLKSPELMYKEIQRRAKEDVCVNKAEQEKREIEKELSRLSKAKDKILDAYQATECMSLEELKSRMMGINREQLRLNKMLEELKASILQEKNQDAIRLNIEYFVKCLDKSKTDLSIKEKQKVARLLINEIVVNKDDITIRHCIPLKPMDGWSENSLLCSNSHKC